MTSITQLLSPWPVTKTHSIVLRDHPEHILPASYQSAAEVMQQSTPSQQGDSSLGHDNLASSEQSDGGEHQIDGRKGYGKRELSTSKRAAQNRAAQRAFRQRKEGYIKKLEEQVRDYQILSENFKTVQSENYQLRDYVISLQSRLLESQGEVPPPPSNVDGLQPGKPNQPPQTPTLPRLAEMGAVGQQTASSDTPYFDSSVKRDRPDSMTAAQAALQGSSVLGQQSPTTSR